MPEENVIRVPLEGDAEARPPIEGCQHNQGTSAEVSVTFLEDKNRYVLEVRAHCNRCGTRFEFEELPTAVYLTKPCRDVNGCTATLPIKPSHLRELPLETVEDPWRIAAEEFMRERDALQAERDALAEATLGMLDESGAPNFVQVEATNKETGEEVVITIQRKEGKTPGQLITETRAENALLDEAAKTATRLLVLEQQRSKRLEVALKELHELADGRRHYDGTDGFNCFDALGEVRNRCASALACDDAPRICAGCGQPITEGQSMVGSDVFSVYAHKWCETSAKLKTFSKPQGEPEGRSPSAKETE